MSKSHIFLAILIMWLFVHIISILIVGFFDRVEEADVVVVFGNTVNTDGSISRRLKARLDTGIQLYNDRKAPFIIVSGGLGKEGYNEASVMKDYLVERGIPESAIIQDAEGNTTCLTAQHTKRIMDEHRWASVILVSQYFHILRAAHIIRQVGVKNVLHEHAQIFEWRDFYSIFREVPAFYKYLIFPC